MWLIGGKETTWAADELVQDLPEVAEHQPVYISQDAFFRGEGSKAAAGMSEFADAPSTGFIGMPLQRGTMKVAYAICPAIYPAEIMTCLPRGTRPTVQARHAAGA